jgi:DNA-binding MltR family transcriptional regulator
MCACGRVEPEDDVPACGDGSMFRPAGIKRKAFGSSGSPGDFAARIELSYLLGIVSKVVYSELENIRKVRNRFAHDHEIRGFDDPKIRDRCSRLFLVASLQAVKDDEDGGILAVFKDYDLSQDRFIYLAACVLMTMILSAESDDGAPLRSPRYFKPMP